MSEGPSRPNRAAPGRGAPAEALRAAVFLDRDGTVIEEKEYLSDPGGVSLLPGVGEALRGLAAHGFPLVLVTNQSGVARGLYSWEAYVAVARRVEEVLCEEGVRLEGTYVCPHHPDFTGPCRCRKPRTGLFRDAARDLGLDLSASFYVGDRARDVLPAEVLGGRGVLVRTGHGAGDEEVVPPGTVVVRDLAEAASFILGRARTDPGTPPQATKPADGPG